MKKCIIVHGWSGIAGAGWQGWLKGELEKKGWEAVCPQMPNTDTPVIEAWVAKLHEVVGEPDENIYFVGHSIGCQTIIRYLETIDTKIGGVVFVAPFLTEITNLLDSRRAEENKEIVEGIAHAWQVAPINYTKVNNVINKNTAIFSDNDNHVKLENVKIFEERLNSITIVLHEQGHFSPIANNCLELPIALDELLKLSV